MKVLLRLGRVPLVAIVVWAAVVGIAPVAMARYPAFSIQQGAAFGCAAPPSRFPGTIVPAQNPCERPLSEVYDAPLPNIVADAALRSAVLLAGAALLALTVGLAIGTAAAVLRRRALASGSLIGVTGLAAAVPSFFVAYFLQLSVIASTGATGHRLLPVFGFGYDEHIVLPLLSIAVPAVAVTAQLTAARMSEVLDADFVTTANSKGLLGSWILRVHVLPHVMPVVLEALGSGLRISVASLPIVEYLFVWNGIGYIALQAIAARDPAALTASALVIAALFSLVSAIADLGRRSLARA
ncbi:MAG: ABC transporter permease subunit [Candidatus Limnocylindria bacterium]